MAKRNAAPNDFQEILQTAHEGDHIVLAPGEYKGPFAVEKPVTITGQGKSTILWSGDEPCLLCKCSGIKIGNLALSRTVITLDDVVVVTEPHFQTTFENVTIQKGRAEGVCWTPMEWRVSHHDFGEIQQGYTIEKQISIQVAQKCRISADVPWLRFDRTTLYPGEHQIRTEITAGKECVPGDKLTVEVKLLDERDRELACFDVAATVTSVTFNLSSSHGARSSDGKKIYQDEVSIRFSNTAARKMADILLDEDDQETPDPESAAKDRFYDTFSSQSHLWLIRRRKADRSNEVKCTLTLAARKENGSAVTSKDNGHPLQLLVLIGEEQGAPFFVLDAYRSRFDTQGHPDGYTILAQLQLTRPSPYRGGEISESLHEDIRNLPPAGTLIPTEHQQALWQNYLQIEKKIAEKCRFAVPVEKTNFGAGGNLISFRVDPDHAFTPSDPKAGEPAVFWKKIANCRNDRLSWKASLDAEDPGEDIGTLTGFQESKNKLQVELNEETAKRCLSGQWSPTAGSWLCYNAKGSLSEIKRRENAMKCIQRSQVQNPLLGQFMFDATKARIPKEIVRLESKDLIIKQLNGGGDGDAAGYGQWGAVQKCLASQDLALIQGPPGTGKTTVIVELCYQMARQGKRTLIASQANLAVDNALNRMIHTPNMRVLRIGKPESVEDEGQPYLEANVIHKWLVDTASHCEQRLTQLEQDTGMLQQLLSSETRFVAYLEKQEQRTGLHSVRDAVETETGSCKAAWAEVQKQQDEMSGVIDAFALMAEDLGSVDWHAPAVAHLLGAIAAEVREDSLCRECHGKFQQLIEQVEGDGAFPKGLVPDPPRIFRDAGAIAEQARQLLDSNRTLETRTEGAFQELERYRALLQGIKQKEKHIAGIEKQRQEENAQILTLSGQLRLPEQLLGNIRRFHGSLRNAPAGLLETIADRLRQLTEQAAADGSISTAAAVDWLCRSLLKELYEVVIGQVESHEVTDRLEVVFRDMAGLSDRIVREDPEHKQIMGNLQQLSQKLPATIPGEIPTDPPAFSTFQEIRDAAATLGHAMERAYNPKKIVPSCLSQQLLNLLQGDPNQRMGKWDPEEVARCRGKLASLFTALQELKSRRRTEQERDKAHCREKAVLLADPIRIMLLEALVRTENQIAQEVQSLKQERDGTWTRSKKIQQENKEETARLQSMKDEVAPIHSAAMSTLPAINEIPARLQGPYREVQKSGDPAAFRRILQIDTHRIETIRKAADEINPPALAAHIIAILKSRADALDRDADLSSQEYLKKDAKLAEIRKNIRNFENDLAAEKAWWAATWEAILKLLHQSAQEEDIHSPDFLRRINDRFGSWRKELGRIEQYLTRYQSLVSEWIARLRNPSDQDREELRQEYLNNANVIGVTCSIAGSPEFNREFRDFDMVIVDEVSKATPPELIIPALKGKKVVLIGDHKQLPPMTKDQTIKEVAENAGLEEEEILSLKESLFKRLFQEAPQEIKETLVIQYRMHEQIMNAVNQFYDEKLVCGIIDSKKERAHHLDGVNFKEDQHLIWVATPQTTKFEEKKKDINSKSYYNPSEVDIIAALCDEFNSLWGERRKGSECAPKNLGIITFYKEQEYEIKDKLKSKQYPNLDIRISTVDRFQGMEREVVIVSLVRNNRINSRYPEIGFAEEPPRVNVAFSRAREMLVIVGCMDLFCSPAADKSTEPYINVAKAVQQARGYFDADRFLQLPN